jgi:hypothetical protein
VEQQRHHVPDADAVTGRHGSRAFSGRLESAGPKSVFDPGSGACAFHSNGTASGFIQDEAVLMAKIGVAARGVVKSDRVDIGWERTRGE